MKPEVINKKTPLFYCLFKRVQGITFKVQQTADPAQRNKIKISLNNKEYHENFRVMCS